MKFLIFTMFDVSKTAEMSAVSDKMQANPPPGIKTLAMYMCMGIPFPGFPPNTLLGISVAEAESSEAIAAETYPASLAGATVWCVPVLESAVGAVSEQEKKYRS